MHTPTQQTLPDSRHKERDMKITPDKGGDRMSKGRTTEREKEGQEIRHATDPGEG